MGKIKKKTIYVFLSALLVLYVVIYMIPGLFGVLEPTAVLQYGDLKDVTEAKCYIIRDETVYGASGYGTVDYSRKEGTLIKKGTRVMEFDAMKVPKDNSGEPKEMSSDYQDIIDDLGNSTVTDKNGVSKRKGIFSTRIDGYEKVLNADRIDKITKDDVSGVDAEVDSVRRETAYVKNDPLYKICDNAGWYLLFWIDEDEADKFTEGANVSVTVEGTEMKCRVESVTDDDGDKKAALYCNRYYDGFTEKRIVDAEIVTVDADGLLAENDWITEKDGQKGVYVRTTTDDYIFKPVQILATDGEQSVLAEGTFYDDDGVGIETVLVYDEIQKNPPKDDKETDEEEGK